MNQKYFQHQTGRLTSWVYVVVLLRWTGMSSVSNVPCYNESSDWLGIQIRCIFEQQHSVF